MAAAVRRTYAIAALVLCLLLAVAAPRVSAAVAGGTTASVHGTGTSAHPYRVYVPSSYSAARPAPLLVMTHGCQTTAEQQQRANLLDPLADREGFIVLYPDVSSIEAGAPGPLKNCWQFPLPANWHRDQGSPQAIAAMTRAVMGRWAVDPERVYMSGMSAGSFMTSIMAAAYPDLFAAVAINAGGAYADGLCLGVPVGIPVALSAQMARDEMGGRARIVPRLVTGGDRDQGIPPGCADKALEQGLRTNNLVLGPSQDGPIALTPAAVRTAPADEPGGYPSTVSTYRDPAGCLIGERWLVHGMNHHWPGGSTDPRLKGFTDPKGPSGAEITWAFLKRFTKSGSAFPCAETPVAPAGAAPAPPVAGCKAGWMRLHVPAAVRRLRATVNGRGATIRRSGRTAARVRLPAVPKRGRAVVVRGRDADGRAYVRRVRSRRC
jgi:poly(hydroxyalkanoate) depolymerase family esterase